jgi:glycosyltransferase involved in cell wall biosynthesis
MAFGSCVAVNDTPANLEALGDAGVCYRGSSESLRAVLQELLRDPERAHRYGKQAACGAGQYYSWEAVTTQYEQLFLSLLG